MVKDGIVLGKRYEVLSKIGAGGMADVYKGKDTMLNRYVAIKVLKKEYREDISLKAADSSVTYTFKLSLTKDEKYPTLKIDVLAGKDRLFLTELSQKAIAKDQKQSLKKMRTTGEKTMEVAQKDRDKTNGKDGMEKYFWLYGNKKNTDGMTLTHYLYGVDIPAFLNKIKENCGVDLTQLAQKFDYY